MNSLANSDNGQISGPDQFPNERGNEEGIDKIKQKWDSDEKIDRGRGFMRMAHAFQ